MSCSVRHATPTAPIAPPTRIVHLPSSGGRHALLPTTVITGSVDPIPAVTPRCAQQPDGRPDGAPARAPHGAPPRTAPPWEPAHRITAAGDAQADAGPSLAWLAHPTDIAALCHAQPANAPYPIILTTADTTLEVPPAQAQEAARRGFAIEVPLLDCGTHLLISPQRTAHPCHVYGLALTDSEWRDLNFHEALGVVARGIQHIRAASGAALIGAGAWSALHPGQACSLPLQRPGLTSSPAAAADPAAGTAGTLHLHARPGALQILDLPGAIGRAAAVQLERQAETLLLLDPEQLSAALLALAGFFTEFDLDLAATPSSYPPAETALTSTRHVRPLRFHPSPRRVAQQMKRPTCAAYARVRRQCGHFRWASRLALRPAPRPS